MVRVIWLRGMGELVANGRRVTNQTLVVKNEEPLTNGGPHEFGPIHAKLRA